MAGKDSFDYSLLDWVLLQYQKGDDDKTATKYVISHLLKEYGVDSTDKLSTMVINKLTSDGFVDRHFVKEGLRSECYLILTEEGKLFAKRGGYKWKHIRQNIPNTTALIGCITGTISFLWLVINAAIKLVEMFSQK